MFVTNPDGKRFRVRVVVQGMHYGARDCLVHVKPMPMIEFYDADASVEKFGERGQFVARYYLSTLAKHGNTPLCLCGHVAAWWIDGENVRDALRWAESECIR